MNSRECCATSSQTFFPFKLDNKESNGESNMWCKTDGKQEDRGPNGDVGIEVKSGSDGKGEWSKMVWACIEEG